MPPYRQPGHATGKCDPAAVTAACPSCGLPGRRVGSSGFPFRCDNGHHFEKGDGLLPATPSRPLVKPETDAAQFFDVVTGNLTKP